MDALDAVVGIPLSDLELVRSTLNSAYYQNTALDLCEGYRRLHQSPQSSPLTKALQNALTTIVAYIEMAEEDGPEEDQEQPVSD